MKTGSKAYPWFLFTLATLAGTAIIAHAASLDLASARKVRREITRLEARLVTIEPDASLVREVETLSRNARQLESCVRRTESAASDCHIDAIETLHQFDRLAPHLDFEAQESPAFRRQLAKLETAMTALRTKVEGPWELNILRVTAVLDGRTFEFSGRFKVEILTACVREARAAGLVTIRQLLIDGETTEITAPLAINTACRLVAEAAE